MINLIKQLLPILQFYGKKVEKPCNFTGIPWTFTGADGKRTTYIFRAGNELSVSRDGAVSKGNWDFLPEFRFFFLETNGQKNIYQPAFLDDYVFILKQYDADLHLVFVNQLKAESINVAVYLNNLALKHELRPARPALSLSGWAKRAGRWLRGLLPEWGMSAPVRPSTSAPAGFEGNRAFEKEGFRLPGSLSLDLRNGQL